MIADRNNGVQVQSSLKGDKIAMSIDQAGMVHMMALATDMYSDQELACIREYSTNGWDAHVEAGTTNRPIEVTTPNSLSPFLRVRDYGVGLTVDDIHNIYSKYGASTKRESNDFNGMLGIGCKAALSYTAQFTVTSVKDGTRVQVAVSREEDGGSMTVVDTASTSEPDGTEVTIPARRENQMQSKAEQFFKVWKPGTVLLNGKDPSGLDGIPIGDSIIVYKGENRYSRPQDYVVMGNVAYPASIDHNMPYGYGMLAFVPMGSVVIHPSRERLIDTEDKTRETLRKAADDFAQRAPFAVQKAIDAASTPAEAIEALTSYRAILRSGPMVYSYKGTPLPESVKTGHGTRWVERRSSALSSNTSTYDIEVQYWPESVWMVNHTGEKFTANHKRKILQWCASNNHDAAKRFILMPGALPDAVKPWVAKANVIDWSVIKAEKLPTATANPHKPWIKPRIAGSFDVFVKDEGGYKHGMPAADIDQSKPVLWVHGNRYAARFYFPIMPYYPDCTLVMLPGNRLDKFARDFPTAIRADVAAANTFKTWKAKLTKDQLEALAMAVTGNGGAFASMDILRVNDPAVKRAIRLAKIDLTKLSNERSMFRKLGCNVDLPSWNNPLAAYPLAYSYRGTETLATEHKYTYINAVYAAAKKNGA